MTYLKERNILVTILLYLFTCGIYPLAMWFLLSSEIRNECRKEDVNPPMGGFAAFLLSIITCGIYSFFYVYSLQVALQKISSKENISVMDPALVAILHIFGVGFILSSHSASELAIAKQIKSN